jgi:RNA polymerase primary sigma factor
LQRPFDEDSLLGRYLSEIREHSLLTREEEIEIARAAREGGDEKELNKLVESNLSFVIKIAGEFRNMGIPFEDLLNEGNIGLIEAARRYDPSRGAKFITYAVWWIRKRILNALCEHSGLVRIPKYQMRKIKKVREAVASLSRSLGRPPDREEISSSLESTISEIDEVLLVKPTELSLDDKVGREDLPISSQLVDEKSTDPEEVLLRIESEALIRWAVQVLTDQEKTVITNRFGMKGRSLTLREIGESLGLSRERIRQIEEQAKRKLRRAYESRTSPDSRGRFTPPGSPPRGDRTPEDLSGGPSRPPARG